MKNGHQGRIWDDKIRYYREMTKDNDMWTKCRVFKIKQLEPEWKADFKMWMAPEAKKRFGKSRPPSSKVKLLRYFRCSVSRGNRFVSPFLAQLREIYRNGFGTRLKQSFSSRKVQDGRSGKNNRLMAHLTQSIIAAHYLNWNISFFVH